jgi:hypothetical protein
MGKEKNVISEEYFSADLLNVALFGKSAVYFEPGFFQDEED